MTYQQADEYREKYKHIIAQHSPTAKFPYRIKYLLIAPKDRMFAERLKVLERSLGIEGNEIALRNLGFLNDNLDIYVIGEKENDFVEMFLYDYLSETSQEL